jgi:hypothetical protein
LAEAQTWLALQQEDSLKAFGPVALEVAIGRFRALMNEKSSPAEPVNIEVDREGLRDQGVSAATTVTFDVDGKLPRCTIISLILEQCRLRFFVREDGTIVVTSIFTNRHGESLMDVADAIEGYGVLRYTLFWAEKRVGRRASGP